MKLVIDDSDEKYEMVKNLLVKKGEMKSHESILRAVDYQQAISTINTFPIDYIYLDHDLGESEKTGYDIAKYLVEKGYKGVVDVISFNPVGRKNIQQLLAENGIKEV